MAKKKEVKVKAKAKVRVKAKDKYLPSVDELADALKINHGYSNKTADSLGSSKAKVSRMISKNKRLQKIAREYKALYHQTIIEKAKDNIFKKVMAGDIQVSKYILERLGKDEGFGNQQDINIGAKQGTENITFRMEFLDENGKRISPGKVDSVFHEKKKV